MIKLNKIQNRNHCEDMRMKYEKYFFGRVDSCRAKDKFKCDMSLSSYYLFRFFFTFRDYQNFVFFSTTQCRMPRKQCEAAGYNICACLYK